MKYTLLEIVQEILSDMDSDEVDSINDTTEATQVAHIVKETYYFIVSQMSLPEHKGVFSLNDPPSASNPVQMTLPDNVLLVDWIKYDCKVSGETNSNFQEICFVEYPVFLEMSQRLNADDDDVDTMTISGFEYKFKNNAAPTFWTTPDDGTVLFNSYDSEIDTAGMAGNKSFCYGLLEPTFTLSDSFTPDLDEMQFNLLVNEAKRAAFNKLKQMTDPISEQRARKGWIRSIKTREKLPNNVPAYSRYPNYGR